MKFYLRFIPLLLTLSIGWSPWASAQICTPDTSFTVAGIYPSQLPTVCAGVPYSQTLTLVIPEDTTVQGFSADIDSVKINNVIGLPPGITYSCSPLTCSFLGGSTGCALISGVVNTPGTDTVDIALTFFVQTFIGTLAIPDTQALIITVAPGFNLSSNTVPASCGATDGQASVSVVGGSAPPYTYLWSDGQTTDTAFSLAAGVYNVTVADTNGCTFTSNVVVPNSGPTPSITVDAATYNGCTEDSAGVISITASGGAGNYTYAWSNGETTEDISNLVGGTYTVTVTDGANCTASEVVNLVQPAFMDIVIDTVINITCFGDASGSATAIVTGGAPATAGYNISWNTTPMQTGLIASNLTAGAYTLMVSDSAGCTKTRNISVSQPDSLALNLSSTDESEIGAENGTASSAVTGGTPPLSYSWSNGETTTDIDSLAGGNYVLTITDGNNCVAIDSVTVSTWPVSIEDELAAGLLQIEIFPNPNQGRFKLGLTFEEATQAKVNIFDLQGRLVKSLDLPMGLEVSQEIELAARAGVYVLQIQTEDFSAYRRIMLR